MILNLKVSLMFLNENTVKREGSKSALAERVGFEPTIPITQDSGFRDRRLQPLGHLSLLSIYYF